MGMKGNNSMQWNQATLREAVQHYLETKVFRDGACPTVISVTAASGSRAYEGDTFEVKLGEPEPKPGV